MTKNSSNAEQGSHSKGRQLALVIAGTGLFWVLGHAIGMQLEWTPKTRILIDLFAMAGFFWGLVVGIQIWRARQG
jgi:hypothetical protein